MFASLTATRLDAALALDEARRLVAKLASRKAAAGAREQARPSNIA